VDNGKHVPMAEDPTSDPPSKPGWLVPPRRRRDVPATRETVSRHMHGPSSGGTPRERQGSGGQTGVASALLQGVQLACRPAGNDYPASQATVALVVGRHRLPTNGKIYRSRKAARRRLTIHVVAVTVAAIGIAMIIMSILVVTGRIQIIGTGVEAAIVPGLMIPAYLLSSLSTRTTDHGPHADPHHPHRQHQPAHPNARSVE